MSTCLNHPPHTPTYTHSHPPPMPIPTHTHAYPCPPHPYPLPYMALTIRPAPLNRSVSRSFCPTNPSTIKTTISLCSDYDNFKPQKERDQQSIEIPSTFWGALALTACNVVKWYSVQSPAQTPASSLTASTPTSLRKPWKQLLLSTSNYSSELSSLE